MWVRNAVLALVARWLTTVVTCEYTLRGMGQFRLNVTQLSTLGVPWMLSALIFVVLHAVQSIGVVSRHFTSERRAATNFALAGSAAMGALMAKASGDATSAATSFLLFLVFSKDTVLVSSSRGFASTSGILASDYETADALSSFVRGSARRYRLGANSMIAAVVVIGYTFWVLPRSSSPLAREMARAQLSRAAAAVALLASVGAEDVRPRRGDKKFF